MSDFHPEAGDQPPIEPRLEQAFERVIVCGETVAIATGVLVGKFLLDVGLEMVTNPKLTALRVAATVFDQF